MKRLPVLILMGVSFLSSVEALVCNDTQRAINDKQVDRCVDCPAYTRAQLWQGNPNAYCQGMVCPDANSLEKSYINQIDGTCKLCATGTKPSEPGSSNGLRTKCEISIQSVIQENPTPSRPVCRCYQTFNPATNRCDSCPVGQLSGNSPGYQNGKCRAFNQNCRNRGQVQLNQKQCYGCQRCPPRQTLNSSTNTCMAVTPRIQCRCDQVLNSATGQCVQCPSGQLSKAGTDRCEAVTQRCNMMGAVQLGQDQCYGCQRCDVYETLNTAANKCDQAGGTLAPQPTPTPTPRPTPTPVCKCYQFYNRATNQCSDCPAGQLNRGGNKCELVTQNCHEQGSIQYGRENCYSCKTCDGFGTILDRAKNECHSPEPQPLPTPTPICKCYQTFDRASNRCRDCPGDQQNMGGRCGAVMRQPCMGNQYNGGREQCQACLTCPPGQVVNFNRNGCTFAPTPLPEPEINCPPGQVVNFNSRNGCTFALPLPEPEIPTPKCGCGQVYDRNINNCRNCPTGMIDINGGCGYARPRSCDSSRNEYSSGPCNKCETCPSGMSVNFNKNGCTRSPSCPPGQSWVNGGCNYPNPSPVPTRPTTPSGGWKKITEDDMLEFMGETRGQLAEIKEMLLLLVAGGPNDATTDIIQNP